MTTKHSINLTDLVDEHTSDLYNWAVHKVSDAELAKDLVQDTFLAAAEKLDSFRGESQAKTWLFSILNFKIIDVYRKKTKQAVKGDVDVITKFFNADGGWINEQVPREWDEDEENLLDNEEFQYVLYQCLNALPDKWGSAVKAKYLLNKKGEEICQDLDITPTNFWQIVHRAKLQLRACVDKNWFKEQ